MAFILLNTVRNVGFVMKDLGNNKRKIKKQNKFIFTKQLLVNHYLLGKQDHLLLQEFSRNTQQV